MNILCFPPLNDYKPSHPDVLLIAGTVTDWETGFFTRPSIQSTSALQRVRESTRIAAFL